MKEGWERKRWMLVTQWGQDMKQQKSQVRSVTYVIWLISCCTLLLVRGKQFRNLFAMKVSEFRHSSSSAEAAAAADDLSIVNAFVMAPSPWDAWV
jgi:beta-lactamase regulating signal transducer with metallopeptidase domain